MGVRIEHRQADIDRTQYGRARGGLPAADGMRCAEAVLRDSD